MVPARHRSGCEKGRPGEKAAPLSIVRVPHPGQPYRYSIPTGAVLIMPAKNLIGAESVQERPIDAPCSRRGLAGTRIGVPATQWPFLRPRSLPDAREPATRPQAKGVQKDTSGVVQTALLTPADRLHHCERLARAMVAEKPATDALSWAGQQGRDTGGRSRPTS